MKRPIYLFGPCAAETEEQVLSTAMAIRQACSAPVIYRAGIWKPRTSPASFQGVGASGLAWLGQVTQVTGMATAVEVATPDQVQAAIQARIPYWWIGARTSANPMAVQAISDTIREYICRYGDIGLQALLIKNPVNEDSALWIGNVERLEKAGVQVMAIHRGCNHQPCWDMAYRLRQQRPDIPLLLDPSHMSGERTKVPELCRVGRALDFDGLMIETHIQPSQAWSDASQQLVPTELTAIVEEWSQNASPANDLQWLRCMIDETDDALWNIVERRMAISHRIGAWKKREGIPVVQPERYSTILQQRIDWAQQHGISEQTVRQIFDAIHEESIRNQE